MKVTKEQQAEALKLANERKFKALWINENGEFFTDPSFAAMSVKYDKEKFAKVDLGVKVEKPESKTTTDLDKATDVIAKIEAAETKEAVEAILKAETEGRNRKSVIDSGNKKLESFPKTNETPVAETQEKVIAEIEAETDLEKLETFLIVEKESFNRPEVIEAAEKKIELLKKPE